MLLPNLKPNPNPNPSERPVPVPSGLPPDAAPLRACFTIQSLCLQDYHLVLLPLFYRTIT